MVERRMTGHKEEPPRRKVRGHSNSLSYVRERQSVCRQQAGGSRDVRRASRMATRRAPLSVRLGSVAVALVDHRNLLLVLRHQLLQHGCAGSKGWACERMFGAEAGSQMHSQHQQAWVVHGKQESSLESEHHD